MNAIYFGRSDEPLFGAYDPPAMRRTPPVGAVFCPPFGQGYMRAHKAMRQLATQLSREGFHVLRFDYFGTGDSSGRCDAGTLERWTVDIEAAIGELKDTSGVDRVSLVGLRMGAALAARVAECRHDVDALVLWDPIVNGAEHLRHLGRMGLPADGSGRLTDGADDEETVSVRGFPLTAAMRRGMAGLDLGAVPLTARRTLLVVSEERGDTHRLRDEFRKRAFSATYAHIPSPSTWESASSVGGDEFSGAIVLPRQMIHGIVRWLGDGAVA